MSDAPKLDPFTVETCAKIATERLEHWKTICEPWVKGDEPVDLYQMGCRAEAATIERRIRSLTSSPGKPAAPGEGERDSGSLPSLPLPAEAERDPDVRPTWDERGLPLCDDACPNFDGKRCKAMGFRPDRFCEPMLITLLSERATAPSALREGQEGKVPESDSPIPVGKPAASDEPEPGSEMAIARAESIARYVGKPAAQEVACETWCSCHLNNGMDCGTFYEGAAKSGYCLHCGHERKCHGPREPLHPSGRSPGKAR